MLEYYTLDVYNRWGAKIFSGKPNEGWDGRVDDDFAQQGTYVYDIYYKETYLIEIKLKLIEMEAKTVKLHLPHKEI